MKNIIYLSQFLKEYKMPEIVKYKREDLSKKLLGRCQVCVNGGKNIFPDGIDFDPTKEVVGDYYDEMMMK